MITFTPKDFKVRAGSHLALLAKIVLMSEGPVLELGTGFYSTPMLHWLCADSNRELVSYDSSDKYIEIAQRYATPLHTVHFVTDWSKIDISRHWGVVFVDHYPSTQRRVEIERVANNADYVVAHDSELKHDGDYQYSKMEPLFKYRYDYNKFYPPTVVFSNFKDLTNL